MAKARQSDLQGKFAKKPALGMGNGIPEVGFLRPEAPEIQALIASLRAMRRAGITMARQAENALRQLGVPFEE
ncbi:MAG: hypothetical protein DRI61_13245 [Chloroflexi bacterium]|nr:MAG: hypothetical protein DRI61_13245 [Chloroflexota bacterium]